MRTLYHFRSSPFSRRVRLALAHKGLEAELRDTREHPELAREARALGPFRTVPVLVEDGQAMGDSTAIVHWLDRAYPERPLWPGGDDARPVLQVVALADLALSGVVDLGTRYFALREHPAWEAVKGEMLGRAQDAADTLGAQVASLGRPTIARSGWSAADIWLLTLTLWLEALPERAKTLPHIAQILTLGFRPPPELSRWADAHRDRPDVRAL